MNILVSEDNDGSARVTTSHKLSFSPGLALGVGGAGREVRAVWGRGEADAYDDRDNGGREHEAQ